LFIRYLIAERSASRSSVAHSIETLRARVRGFLDELEPEVSVVVDSMLPSHRLTTLLVYSTLSSRRCRFVSRCRLLAASSAWCETAMLASAWEASCIWRRRDFAASTLKASSSFPRPRPVIRSPMRAKPLHRYDRDRADARYRIADDRCAQQRLLSLRPKFEPCQPGILNTPAVVVRQPRRQPKSLPQQHVGRE
jgi:hypothetical protein